MSTKSEDARNFWRQQFNKDGIDLTNSDLKRKLVTDFLTDPTNQKNGWTKSDKKTFGRAFLFVLTEQNKDLTSYGMNQSKQSTQKTDNSITIQSTPEPKKEPVTETRVETTPEPQTTQQSTQDNTTNQTQIVSTMSADTVSIVFDSMINIISARVPNVTPLSTEEKNGLGQAWLPIFEKYFSGASNSKWVAPLLVTLPIAIRIGSQVLASKKKEEEKIYESKETQKEKQSKGSAYLRDDN